MRPARDSNPESEPAGAAGANAPAQAGLREPEGKRTAAEGRGDFAEQALGLAVDLGRANLQMALAVARRTPGGAICD
jgi:hypothetical protein